MAGISRRNLIAGAGAGLALAGCRGKEDAHGLTAEKLDKILWEMKGAGDLWGHSAATDQPCPLALNGKFEPRFLCVQYLKFDGISLIARRGYVDGAGQDENALLGKVPGAIADLRNNVDTNFVATSGGKILRDLDFIGFGSQQIFAIYLDNDPNLVKIEDDQAKSEFVVRFAPYSGIDPHSTVNPPKKNNAFCKLRVTSAAGLIGGLILLNFWNTDAKGEPIDRSGIDTTKKETWHRYSMNIHLQMAVPQPDPAIKKWVPLVLDPDTGNMGGVP